jgi:hypothetical protein
LIDLVLKIYNIKKPHSPAGLGSKQLYSCVFVLRRYAKFQPLIPCAKLVCKKEEPVQDLDSFFISAIKAAPLAVYM